MMNIHGLPIVSLVDTPGFMVGPDTEATGQVRHASGLFLAAARLTVSFFSVVLRKGYGLGAMGLEGAVADDAAREALFQQLLAQHIAKGSAISMAEHLEIDAVIDPAHT